MALFETFGKASTHVVNGPIPTMQDSEVFVYAIPDDVTKQELISMFEICGNICNFRVASRSPQMAFIRFTEPQAVRVAVLRWNAFEIRANCRIFVCRSVVNKSLVLLNIPRHLTASSIYRTVSIHTTGLSSVHISPPRDDMGVNSGLVILRFKTRSCANVAKTSLNESLKLVWNRRVYVEWHTPGLIWNDYETTIPTSGEASSNFLPLGQPTDFTRMHDGHGANSSLLPLPIRNRGQDIQNFPLLREPTDCNRSQRRNGSNSSVFSCPIPPPGQANPNFIPMGERADFFGAWNGNRANSSQLPIGSEIGSNSFLSDWSARRNDECKFDRRNKYLNPSSVSVEE